MFKLISKIFLSFSILTTSTIASASLITNGSFEQLNFADNTESIGVYSKSSLQSFANKNSTWDVFYSLPGWVTTAGNGIELQRNIIAKSKDGANHVELDSHGRKSNGVMTQTLDSLTIGADYLLEFSYKPRTNKKNDNGINVFWYETATEFDLNMDADLVIDGRSKKYKNWAVQSIILTAQSEIMNLSFGAFGKQNSYGGLIDNVSLVQVNKSPATDIPEPSVFALSMFGFALLVRRQHKINTTK